MPKRKHETITEIAEQQEAEGPSLDGILANLAGNDDAKPFCDAIRTLLNGKQARVRNLCVPWKADLIPPVRNHSMGIVRAALQKRFVQHYATNYCKELPSTSKCDVSEKAQEYAKTQNIDMHAEAGHYEEEVGSNSSFVFWDQEAAAALALEDIQDGAGRQLVNAAGEATEAMLKNVKTSNAEKRTNTSDPKKFDLEDAFAETHVRLKKCNPEKRMMMRVIDHASSSTLCMSQRVVDMMKSLNWHVAADFSGNQQLDACSIVQLMFVTPSSAVCTVAQGPVNRSEGSGQHK